MIPSSDIPKILGLRNGGSDAESAHFDMLESDFTLSPDIRIAYHEQVIKGPFSKQLGSFTTIMMDEISNSMEHKLGRDQEGVIEMKVFDTVAQVIACTANRVFVGKDIGMLRTRICLLTLPNSIIIGRNDQFNSNATKFAMDVVFGSSILGLMPKWLKQYVFVQSQMFLLCLTLNKVYLVLSYAYRTLSTSTDAPRSYHRLSRRDST
jgi:hypothetical protein